MIDVNLYAEESLLKTGYTIVYQHPKEKTPLPCVSYYNVSETMGLCYDNEEQIQTGYIQVDIWSRQPAECGEMLINIVDELIKDNWYRVFSMDIPDDSGVYHKTAKFKRNFIL